LDSATPLSVSDPINIRIRFASTTRPDVLEAIPGLRRVDGNTVEYDANNMTEAYKLIRLMYKYIAF